MAVALDLIQLAALLAILIGIAFLVSWPWALVFGGGITLAAAVAVELRGDE